tara:strand:+ start:46055 stop:46657 length:603 start_codon:yes stop_codon:yes gene_type:complete
MMKLKNILRRLQFKKKHVSWRDRFEVGYGTYGEPIVKQWGEATTLKVGKYCSIAGNVTIFLGGNHRSDWITTYPFSIFRDSARHLKGVSASKGDVIIGHDVWLGEASVILSGVKIGNGAVVGASAVVSKDVPAYGVVAGNPARLVKRRFSDEEIGILQKMAWWDWDTDKIDAAVAYLMDGNLLALSDFSDQYDLVNKANK